MEGESFIIEKPGVPVDEIRPISNRSAICIAEMACLAHRETGEGPTRQAEAALLRDLFPDDMKTGLITAMAVTERLPRRVSLQPERNGHRRRALCPQ